MLEAAQWITKNPDAPVIVWVDLMKLGRCSGSEVDSMSELINHAISKRPQASCAVVIAPYLTSEKCRQYRNELRREVSGKRVTQRANKLS